MQIIEKLFGSNQDTTCINLLIRSLKKEIESDWADFEKAKNDAPITINETPLENAISATPHTKKLKSENQQRMFKPQPQYTPPTNHFQFEFILVDQISNSLFDFNDALQDFAKKLSNFFPNCKITTSSNLALSTCSKYVFIFYQCGSRISPEDFQTKCREVKSIVGRNCIFCFGTIGQYPPNPTWLEESSGFCKNEEFHSAIAKLKLGTDTPNKKIYIDEFGDVWKQFSVHFQ